MDGIFGEILFALISENGQSIIPLKLLCTEKYFSMKFQHGLIVRGFPNEMSFLQLTANVLGSLTSKLIEKSIKA